MKKVLLILKKIFSIISKIVVKNNAKAKCWICGASADSAEHRIKKSDMVRAYGRGPYKGDSAPVHVRNGVETPIQGPGSDLIKYQKFLCHKCNTTETQPYDEAYDQLVSWLQVNEAEVLNKRVVNFFDVYGDNFEEKQRNLFKYFVKSFGCRLVDAVHNVPKDLIDLLPKQSFRTALKISFCVNEDILLLPEKSQFVGKGNLIALPAKSNQSIVNGYIWHENYSWFTVNYWYKTSPQSGLGSTWIADAQHVYLGSLSPLSEQQHNEFTEGSLRRADLIEGSSLHYKHFNFLRFGELLRKPP